MPALRDMLFNYRNYGRLWRVYGRSMVRYGSLRKLANAVRTELAYRRRALDVPSRPFILFVEPLYYCNLRCPLCPRELPGYRSTDAKLDLDLFDRVLEELGPYLVQCSIFGNGEPMLDWGRTEQIVRRAHAARVFTLVSTNATLITEAMAKRIVESPLDYLVCAIDGASQAGYETYRVGGRFEDALAGMRRVVEAREEHGRGPFVEWQYLVHRGNEHEMDEARRQARRLGVYLRFAPIGGMGPDPAEQQRWAPRDPRYRSLLERPGQPVDDFHCYWLWRSCFINASGTLGRCPKYSGPNPMGDLREHSVMALYNSPRSQAARAIFNPAPMADAAQPAPCATCTLYHRCHAPARPSEGVSLPVLAEVL